MAGRKVLGFSVPMCFRAGEPFHAGAAWQMMDVGIKDMSGVLADRDTAAGSRRSNAPTVRATR